MNGLRLGPRLKLRSEVVSRKIYHFDEPSSSNFSGCSVNSCCSHLKLVLELNGVADSLKLASQESEWVKFSYSVGRMSWCCSCSFELTYPTATAKAC